MLFQKIEANGLNVIVFGHLKAAKISCTDNNLFSKMDYAKYVFIHMKKKSGLLTNKCKIPAYI